MFLILLWTIRFFVEYVNEPQGDEYINWFGFNTGQWLSIPFIIIGLYLLANFSYYMIIGFDNMKGEREIAYALIQTTFGDQAANIFSFFLFFGVLAYVNALLMSNPRVMYAMSAEGTLPAIFSKQDKKTDVLVFSLTIFAAVCIVILFFAQTFEKILIEEALLFTKGRRIEAAEMLGLGRNTLTRKVKELKIEK